MVTYWDDDYPLLLKKIYDTPVLLYIKGEPLKEKEDCVAIVGTRRFTPYGKSATQTIAKDLASRNIAVVSGLAWGIDTIAHKTAVQTGGRTLAVLGSGLDVIYPGENRRLAEDICQKGTLDQRVSPGHPAGSWKFPPQESNYFRSLSRHGDCGGREPERCHFDRTERCGPEPGRVCGPGTDQ